LEDEGMGRVRPDKLESIPLAIRDALFRDIRPDLNPDSGIFCSQVLIMGGEGCGETEIDGMKGKVDRGELSEGRSEGKGHAGEWNGYDVLD
jgi:hypothetical protein